MRALLVAAAVLALATAVFALRREPARGPAPELALTRADGSRISLESLRGRPVLIEFFAVWCPECRRDVTRLEDLSRRLAGKVEVVAVALEGEPAAVEAAVREAGGRYRVGVADRSTGAAYGVTRFPTRFLVDGDGRIVARDVDFGKVIGELDP